METPRPDPQKTPAAPPPAAKPAASAPASSEDAHGIPRDLPRPGPLTIIAMTFLLLVLLAGLLVVGWIPHRDAQEQAATDAADVETSVPSVTVALPKQSAPTTDLVLPCDVKANQETAIYPRTNGYLKAQYVDIQSHVVAGQLLAEIDSPEVDAQLSEARANVTLAKSNVTQTQADLDLAKNTLERYRELQANGGNSVTHQEMDEKENAYALAQAALQKAHDNVEVVQADVDRLTVLQRFEKVIAPFAGTITARNYDIGALLSSSDSGPGKEMFRIAQTDTLRVFVNVPQVYIGDIKLGGPAYLTANDKEFTGSVARTSDAVDTATRTMLFELHFPNKDGRLYAGMYGMARLQLTQSHSALLIPSAALRFDAQGVQVALVRDGKIHLQPVRPGRDLGTELEIVSGLSPEDDVVNNPSERLTEGLPVKVTYLAPKALAATHAPKPPASVPVLHVGANAQ